MTFYSVSACRNQKSAIIGSIVVLVGLQLWYPGTRYKYKYNYYTDGCDDIIPSSGGFAITVFTPCRTTALAAM